MDRDKKTITWLDEYLCARCGHTIRGTLDVVVTLAREHERDCHAPVTRAATGRWWVTTTTDSANKGGLP